MKCCANVNKKIKAMNWCDMKLVKLATAAFVLFLITVWPALLSLVLRVHWGWYLAAAIVFAIRPCMKACC